MYSSLSTIQFSMNPWHMGMSFEAHAYLKEKVYESKIDSKYIFLGGLNQDLIQDNKQSIQLRTLSQNYKNLRFLNNLLSDNDFCDLVRQSRTNSKKIMNDLAQIDFFEILDFVHRREGIDRDRALIAVEMALLDKDKIWKIGSIESYPKSILFLKAYIRSYLSVRRILQDNRTTHVNLFNTRFLNERAARDAALKLSCIITEFDQVNSRGDSFGLFSESIHSPSERATLVKEFAHLPQSTEYLESEPPSQTWINLRRNGALQSFTRRQIMGKLPEMPRGKKIVSCFLSSFDELILAGYAKLEHQITQDNSLETICSIVRRHQDWQLIVRSHPNMLTRPKREQLYWKEKLRNLDAQVIHPEEEFDSYALIESSDLVLTFGSTIGVEAVALGKPSLLLGESLYSGLKICLILDKIEEIEKYLDIPPITSREQIKELNSYCKYQLFGGTRFRYLYVLNEDIYKFNPNLYFRGRRFMQTTRGFWDRYKVL